jgi:hypothetical protein
MASGPPARSFTGTLAGKHDIVKVNLSRPMRGAWVEVYDAGNYNASLRIDQFDGEPDLYLHLPNYGKVTDSVKIVITWPDWTTTTRRKAFVRGCYNG